MCDEALAILANRVQNGEEPFAVFWSENNCQGEQYPPPGEVAKFDSNLTPSNDPTWPSFTSTKSFYVPSNIRVILETPIGKNSGIFIINGPRLVYNIQADPILNDAVWEPITGQHCPADITAVTACSKIQWCFNSASGDNCCQECWNCAVPNGCSPNCTATLQCQETKITTGTIGMLRQSRHMNWESYIEHMCAENYEFYIGKYKITRYAAQSEQCDQFMEAYCKVNTASRTCGCFKDETANASAILQGVDLPVKCFGTNCRISGSYLTREMKSAVCTDFNCENWVIENQQWLLANYPTGVIRCGNFNINIKDAKNTLPDDNTFTRVLFWVVMGLFLVLLLSALVWAFVSAKKS
jgi:hypothetical protein